jgi:xanthine dehydrogenase YagT iron-sulfur-binding subunit
MRKDQERGRVSRRSFFGSVAAGAAGTAVLSGQARAEGPPADARPEALLPLALKVNGREHRVQVEARATLVSVLRDQLGLTGTKAGCERGECGACTVLIDGVARYSCLTLALEAEGREITTVEGLMKGEELGEVQQAFVAEDGFQCGFCTPGQVMAAEGLLRKTAAPGKTEIREGMSGVLCRCGAYPHIFKAVERAAEAKGASHGK